MSASRRSKRRCGASPCSSPASPEEVFAAVSEETGRVLGSDSTGIFRFDDKPEPFPEDTPDRLAGFAELASLAIALTLRLARAKLPEGTDSVEPLLGRAVEDLARATEEPPTTSSGRR